MQEFCDIKKYRKNKTIIMKKYGMKKQKLQATLMSLPMFLTFLYLISFFQVKIFTYPNIVTNLNKELKKYHLKTKCW